MDDDRDYAWSNILQSLENVRSYVSWLPNHDYERVEMMDWADHLIRSAKWHKKQYE